MENYGLRPFLNCLRIYKILLFSILKYFYQFLKMNKQKILIFLFLLFTFIFQKNNINAQGNRKLTNFEKILIKDGLVNIQDIDTSIKVILKYSTIDNFIGMDLYGDFNKCYLQKETANKLTKAQSILKNKNKNYSLIVYDAVRPQSVQQLMWDWSKMPIEKKKKYLSNPKTGSTHSYGVAVDLTIIDQTGRELDMGCPFDFFGDLAQPKKEKELLKKGLLTQKQINNRLLLRRIMQKAGFYSISREWWHFNSCWIKDARKKYKIVKSHWIESKSQEIELNELVNNHQKIIYKVQIVTSKNPIDVKDKMFNHFSIVERYYHKGLYKYTVGKFFTEKDAQKLKNKIRNTKFKNAFVVTFKNDKRVK